MLSAPSQYFFNGNKNNQALCRHQMPFYNYAPTHLLVLLVHEGHDGDVSLFYPPLSALMHVLGQATKIPCTQQQHLDSQACWWSECKETYIKAIEPPHFDNQVIYNFNKQ